MNSDSSQFPGSLSSNTELPARQSSSPKLPVERNSRLFRDVFEAVGAAIAILDVLETGDWHYIAVNSTYALGTETSFEELRGKTPEQVFPPSYALNLQHHLLTCLKRGIPISFEEKLPLADREVWWLTTLTPKRDRQSRIHRVIATSIDITDYRRIEAELRHQAERERLLGAITQRIRQSLNLQTILESTVHEVRQFLQTDRVLIYQFQPNWSGVLSVESVMPPWQSVLGVQIVDPCFAERYIEQYQQGRIHAVDDVFTAGLQPCYVELLTTFQVRANLVVPIVVDDTLWGLLIAHHCQGPRSWQSPDINLLVQLGMQVGIAAQHAELHQQVQQLNIHLEQLVQERTAALQQSLDSEAVMRRMMEKVRDSLDERQILQTAMRELSQRLQLDRCKIDLYDEPLAIATTICEYADGQFSHQLNCNAVMQFPELHHQLFQRQSTQLVELVPTLNPALPLATLLACPIFDEGGILGILWLVRPRQEWFTETETQLVQQVANTCAIAIRQARLYQASLAQVQELEKLDRLKNDFLSTLSHELRTPISAISLASQTLDALLLTDEPATRSDPATVAHLLHILQVECDRESQLINDLLTLTYLDADTEPLTLVTVELQTWLPALVNTFTDRVASRNQQLIYQVRDEVPPLRTDIMALERILTELLTNACKYTPAEEQITVSVEVVPPAAAPSGETSDRPYPRLSIAVTNTGAEIPPEERDRIFSTFYRIPRSDPWQYGGTGLGLALVKKLVQRLGADIQMTSANGQTTFTIQFVLPPDARNE